MSTHIAGSRAGRAAHGCARSALAAAAFTLTELLVVIVIIVLILAIAVPAFTSIIYSQESALAQTRLATAIRTARDAAIQSTGGSDTAAVFFFEPGGRLRIVTCIKAGEIEDVAPASGLGAGPRLVQREIFVPLATLEPTELPRNWMVRAYAPAFSISSQGSWYEANNGGVRYGGPTGREPSWVFPETGFFQVDKATEGVHRQTFMVRFQAGSGVMASTSGSEVLVLSPRASSGERSMNPAELWKRADRATDFRRFVRRILTDQSLYAAAGNTGNTPRRDLLGDRSSDTVLARPVWMLALYDESKLASALGAQVDRTTGCLYQSIEDAADEPRFVAAPGMSSVEMGRKIAQWIGGDTNFSGNQPNRSQGDQPEARIFTIDRFTAEVRPAEVEL